MLISYNELCELVDEGVIRGVRDEHINGTSIDVTLGDTLLVEVYDEHRIPHIDLSRKEAPSMVSVRLLDDTHYVLNPGAFILAQTEQTFFLPNDIACEFKLKSSAARAGLQHALAAWCDPGWHGSTLTMELSNSLQRHSLVLRKGMKIGQMIFFRCLHVPENHSYRVKGRYNNNLTVQSSKGV